MPRTWVVTPYHFDDPAAFQQAWEYDRSNNLVAIGWDLGDLEGLSAEGIRARYLQVYPDDRTRVGCNQVVRFWCDIRRGDRIIARGGRKRILAVGEVSGPAFYDPGRAGQRAGSGNVQRYPNFLPVAWQDIQREFHGQVFGMLTVYELPEAQADRLIAGPVDDAEEPPPESAGDGQAFRLETHLEEFIASNFPTIFQGRLELYRDPEGNTGRQYRTDVGIIDLLARDAQTGDYVVIELKRGQASDETAGQVLRYMGWVREHLCADAEGVRGMVLCQEGDDRLEYALSMVPNVEVRFYQVQFRLTDSPTMS